MVLHRPVQRLHHRRIAVLVRVRERVPARRHRAAQLLPLGGVDPRRVADAAAWKMFGGMRLTICLRMGYTVFVASGGGVFIIL